MIPSFTLFWYFFVCLSLRCNFDVIFQLVVIWNTSQVTKGGQVGVMAKAHTDVDIERMKIAAFDDTRSVANDLNYLQVAARIH